MTNRSEDERRQASQRAQVLNWHSKSVRGYCTECGFAYPCRTRLMLLGRVNEAQEVKNVRLRLRRCAFPGGMGVGLRSCNPVFLRAFDWWSGMVLVLPERFCRG